LLSLTNESEIERLASKIVAEGLSVRAIEEIVATGTSVPKKKNRKNKAPTSELLEIAERLSDFYDTRVSVQSGKGKGKITIEFSGISDLKRILDLLEE
jgi:ParB family chromosome partitioning protein